jgi:hypothetical protein
VDQSRGQQGDREYLRHAKNQSEARQDENGNPTSHDRISGSLNYLKTAISSIYDWQNGSQLLETMRFNVAPIRLRCSAQGIKKWHPKSHY